MKNVILILCLLSLMHSIDATNYYVSPGGNDTNTGVTVAKAFKTLQKAAGIVLPGDTVFVMEGIYSNQPGEEAILEITRSGKPEKWIVFTNYPGQMPKLRFNCWEGIRITGASYIKIKGFEIEGNADNVTLNYAIQEMSNLKNPLTSGNGISIKTDSARENIPHHIHITNNIVYKCGGGGIGAMHCDYITISGNRVSHCGFFAPYANSGISVYQAKSIDDFEGYKIIITGNTSYSNYNYIPFYFSNVNDPSKREFTDGNGIIIDDLLGAQDFVGKSMEKPYNGKCLVINNIVYNNGGSGIHSFSSSNIDIINNTAYKNGQNDKMNPGQIFAIACENITIENNIMVAIPGKKINNDWNNKNVIYDHNLYFDGTENPVIKVIGANTIIADPQFVAASEEFPDFHLRESSPCINAGLPDDNVKTDFENKLRNTDKNIDLGALEYFK